MSHRLQHLQRKRPDSNQTTIIQTANSNISSPSTFTQSPTKHQSTQKQTNTSPIFAPIGTIPAYSKNDYKKGQKAFPPPDTLYLPKDTEVDPCFLRVSTMALYAQPKKSSLPISIWVTPFASDRVNVLEVKAPLRCSACKAYVNPYFNFDGTRRVANCNLCKIRFPIDEGIDKGNLQSAEVATQSIIDFRVSDKIYFKRRIDVVKMMIVLELSMNTLELGVYQTVISGLISAFQSSEFESKIRVGIVFYNDQGVGYLRKSEQGNLPTVFLVPNNKNNISCCPLSDEEMLFDPNHQKQQLLQSLNFLEGYGNSFWKQERFSHTANYVFALKSIKESFDQQTGKILLFSCLDPRWGSCSIRSPNTEQEKIPLLPIHMQFYQLGKEFMRARVGLEHFYFSKDNLVSHQLATTHFLSSLTGGQLHLYSGYNHSASSNLYYRIFHSLTRPTYFEADFTCRTSPGLSVVRYGVGEGLREGRDIALSTLTSASSFLVELSQEEKLEEFQGAYIQFAMLYTTGRGERRIRVINFKFDVTPSIESHYDSIDYLTLANSIARNFSHRLLKTDHLRIRDEAIGLLARLISQFQGQCKNALSIRMGGDLVVPQGFAWTLHYLHSVFISKLFLRDHKVTTDERILEYLKLQASNPYFFASRLYPHLYPLTLDIYDEQPMPGDFIQDDRNDTEKIAVLPASLPLKKEYLSESGVYLYESCDEIIILVQPHAGEELLLQLFGSTNWEKLEKDGLPQLETSHNIRVNNIVSEIRRRNTQSGGMYQPLIVKTPLKKKQYSQLLTTILKEDATGCNFSQMLVLIRGALSSSK